MPETVKTAMHKAVAKTRLRPALASDEIDRPEGSSGRYDKAKDWVIGICGRNYAPGKRIRTKPKYHCRNRKAPFHRYDSDFRTGHSKTARNAPFRPWCNEMDRMRADYKKLQTELITIAKTKAKQNSRDKPTVPALNARSLQFIER